MASTIITKNSSTAGAVPLAANLTQGELAINTTDRRLYTKDATGTVVEVGSGTAIVYRENFSGNDVTTVFTMAHTPVSEDLVDIYINGIYQNKDTFSVSTNVITFTEAPVSGTDNIEVMIWQSAPIGSTDANYVSYTPAGAGAVATTVQTKLREYVSVTNYTGFVGNGTNDDKAALEAAAAYCVSSGKGLYCPPGYSIKLSASVSLKNIRNIRIESDIIIDSGTLTVGGNVNAGKFTVYLQSVTNGTSPITSAPPASPVVRATGLFNSQVTIGACNYIQLYADASVTNERAVAYNQFTLTGAVSLLEITDSGTALSYVNENFIYADRVIRYKVIGVGYAHNHNKLFHPCMEGSNAEIVFSGNLVSANQVYGARFEGVSSAPGVTFGAGTYSNTVIGTWSGVGSPRAQFIVPIPVSDSGSGNMVATEASTQFIKTPLFAINANSLIAGTSTRSVAQSPRITPSNPGVDNISSRQALVPGLAGVTSVYGSRYWALTEPIPVNLGDTVVWDADYDGSLVRTIVFVYDQNMQPLTTEGGGGVYWSQAGTSIDGVYGKYSQGADQPASALLTASGTVYRAEVKYIRVGFYTTSAGVLIRNFGASLYTQALNRGASQEWAAQNYGLLSINATPTRSYLPLDFMVYETTGGTWKRVTYQYENSLNGALAAGATSATVNSPASIANGDICGILLDDKTTHWTTVSGLVGSTFTIGAIPVGRSAPNNGRIVFNRWA
jgi:hypothetical protein